jgi:hypothetical protein
MPTISNAPQLAATNAIARRVKEVLCRASFAAKQPSDQNRRGEINPNDGQVNRVGMKGLQEA